MSRRLLTLALAAPTLAAALGILAVEGSRLRSPESPLFATPFAYSLADAIERDDVARAYGFIRAGQDPNAPIPVRHPVLTGGRDVLVAPLVWAAATNRPQAVRMLLGFGVRADGPAGTAAACLAHALGYDEIAGLLRQYRQSPEPAPCPARGTQSMILG